MAIRFVQLLTVPAKTIHPSSKFTGDVLIALDVVGRVWERDPRLDPATIERLPAQEWILLSDAGVNLP